MRRVRTRFAPSPTGPLHIGGVRTALYCYLFAKKNNGDFLLRIEDTDRLRYVEGAEEYIYKSLEWCGIISDENPIKGGMYSPYRQSERKNIYKKYALELLERGFAYYAFDTQENLEKIRQNEEDFTYNYKTRGLLDNSFAIPKEELQDRLNNNEKFVIRFKIPENREILVNDIIRGEVKYNSNILDDKILFKSDGMPTYHLANVVDDMLMNISHVIRGEEWLPSTPLHVLLYEAFGWNCPEFAHLPLILKPEGKGKLSKRDGDKGGFPVFPLDWLDKESNNIFSGYREQGYFPEAFINMLALLGWHGSNNEKEIFSMQELIDNFSLDRVSKSGAKFNPEKAKWFNQQYLRLVDNNIILRELISLLEKKGLKIISQEKGLKIIEILKDRINFVKEIVEDNSYFFERPNEYNPEHLKKTEHNDIIVLEDIIILINENSIKELQDSVLNFIKSNGLNTGKIMKIFRLSIVGDLKGPDLFQIINILGKDEVIHRIKKFLNKK